MTDFEKQPVRNAIHGRLKAIADANRNAKSDQVGQLEKTLLALMEKVARQEGWKDLIDAQGTDVALLTDWIAGHDKRLACQELRLQTLEARHRYRRWLLHPWVPRVLMYGISPSSLKFNASEVCVRGLRKAGYESIQDLLAVKPDKDRKPAKIVHAELAKAHQDDPDNVQEPPAPEEVEEVMIIAQRMIEQKGA
ncbi:hypothetical protein [uncultured Jannaschia sp.]|uniref:hypothetical protein n=1 Tax=uncultured Jannaschia sp. TaxID=293347 RepID=UPI0026073173|nr:hypothetical protein [uncultured Jannaschia sp.]